MSNDLQKHDSNGKLIKSTQERLDLSTVNIAALNKSLSTLDLPRLFYQLVVFVFDGSGSMTFSGISGESKGKEVSCVVTKIIERLVESKNKNSFDISMWAFADESVEVFPVISVCSIDLNKSMNPCEYIKLNKWTKLSDTLLNVKKISEEYLIKNEDKNSQVLLIILSDGEIHDIESSCEVAKELKINKRITIDAVFFESKKRIECGEEEITEQLKSNLRSLASNDTFFTSTIDPEQIRKHMIKSISTVSKTTDIQ